MKNCDKEQVITLNVYEFWWQVIGWIADGYHLGDRWLAEVWVKLGLQS